MAKRLCMVVLVFVLVGCKQTLTVSSPTPGLTTTSGYRHGTPEAAADVVITALRDNDVVTLNQIVAPSMPLRDMELDDQPRQWNERQKILPGYYFDKIGPIVQWTTDAPIQIGQTTRTVSHIVHRLGTAELTLNLMATSSGWQVVSWTSRVVTHPRPTPTSTK